MMKLKDYTYNVGENFELDFKKNWKLWIKMTKITEILHQLALTSHWLHRNKLTISKNSLEQVTVNIQNTVIILSLIQIQR